jgi:NAD(P)-dependent dehydrogenase (short-subunit alcohol dehydrogenase family)
MKIIIVGANGTIGKKVTKALGSEHEIIPVGKTSGKFQVDISDPTSIKAMYQKIGKFDALISVSGKSFSQGSPNPDPYESAIRLKFMGQVNLVNIGKEFINEGGSFTLTSGILADSFVKGAVASTAINRAIEGFAQAVTTEIGRGIRVNVVSPGVLVESFDQYKDFFVGHIPVEGSVVAQFYKRSVLGVETGQIFKIF